MSTTLTALEALGDFLLLSPCQDIFAAAGCGFVIFKRKRQDCSSEILEHRPLWSVHRDEMRFQVVCL